MTPDQLLTLVTEKVLLHLLTTEEVPEGKPKPATSAWAGAWETIIKNITPLKVGAYVLVFLLFANWLNDQRLRAEKGEADAIAAEKFAEERAVESRDRLIRLEATTGVSHVERGELPEGLLWFVRALRTLETSDVPIPHAAERARSHRIRIARLATRLPTPAVIMTLGERATVSYAEDGKTVVAPAVGRLHILDGSSLSPTRKAIKRKHSIVVGVPLPGGRWVALGLQGQLRLLDPSSWADAGAVPDQELPAVASELLRHHAPLRRGLLVREGRLSSLNANAMSIRTRAVQSKGDWLRVPNAGRPGKIGTACASAEGTLVAVAYRYEANSDPSASSDRAAGDPREATSVRILDVSSGAQQGPFLIHDAPVTSLAFSDDGTALYAGAEDGKLSAWRVSTGKRLWVAQPHRAQVQDIVFSGDQKYVATPCGRQHRTCFAHGIWGAPQCNPDTPLETDRRDFLTEQRPTRYRLFRWAHVSVEDPPRTARAPSVCRAEADDRSACF